MLDIRATRVKRLPKAPRFRGAGRRATRIAIVGRAPHSGRYGRKCFASSSSLSLSESRRNTSGSYLALLV
jgi:hypothetical protein